MVPHAFARSLVVGQGAAYARPSDAAKVAQPGDQVRILPGVYYDCAVWTANHLVIEGAGPDTVITDTTCQGKAVFVIAGRGITVRDLTLARARVADGNGAGIRAEAPDLLIERVRFENNQDGLLAGDQPTGTLRVEDCTFVGNGVADGNHPTAALVVGAWARLVVKDSRFELGQGAAAILSGAAITQIDKSQIAAPKPGHGATVQARGGLMVQDSSLEAGWMPSGRRVAVLAFPAAPDSTLLLRRNVLQGPGTLLLNWSGRRARVEANVVSPNNTEASTSGSWRYRVRSDLRSLYNVAHAAAGALHRRVIGWGH